MPFIKYDYNISTFNGCSDFLWYYYKKLIICRSFVVIEEGELYFNVISFTFLLHFRVYFHHETAFFAENYSTIML